MSINRLYFLTDDDRRLVRDLALRRCDAKRDEVRVQKSGFHKTAPDRDYPHRIGLAAELAYARTFDLRLDERCHGWGDAEDFAGIEVKATTHSRPPFVLAVRTDEYERKRPLAYVLARVDAEYLAVEFCGSIRAADFDRLRAIQNGRHERNWAVSWRRLDAGLWRPTPNGLRFSSFVEETIPVPVARG